MLGEDGKAVGVGAAEGRMDQVVVVQEHGGLPLEAYIAVVEVVVGNGATETGVERMELCAEEAYPGCPDTGGA